MKEAGNKSLLFMMYTTLYTNDMVCNCIKDLGQQMRGRDKETLKIYGALMKRVGEYFNNVNSLLQDNLYFLADFSSYLDDDVDDAIQELADLVNDAYVKAGIFDSEFIAKIEVARSICALSIENVENIQRYLVKEKILQKRFDYGNLTELFKILNNLCVWVYRKVDKQLLIELDKKAIEEKINSITDNVFDFKKFNDAYAFAERLQKERDYVTDEPKR